MIDWTKPIEAVHIPSGRTVPMTFERVMHERFWVTKECPDDLESNREWHEDGRDWCHHNAWFIRNIASTLDWLDDLEVVREDGTTSPAAYDGDDGIHRKVTMLGSSGWFVLNNGEVIGTKYHVRNVVKKIYIAPEVTVTVDLDAGPAFPTHPDFGKSIDMVPAKTMRDEFAMAAMGGDLASQCGEGGFWENATPDTFIADRAAFYYRFADAMMAAREGN